jgi:hypothetical protein
MSIKHSSVIIIIIMLLELTNQDDEIVDNVNTFPRRVLHQA